MELAHLLTRSGLTYPEVSSNVYHDSFCQLGSSVSLPSVIYFEVFYLHITYSLSCMGTAVAQWLRCCATNRKVAGSIPAGVSGFFIDIKSFRSHYGPGVDSSSNRNEYLEYFLGVKSGRCLMLTTLLPSCAVVTKSGNLNFLEPSGPGQACNGTALPLSLLYSSNLAKIGVFFNSFAICAFVL